jgi:MoaA/NifB/PqqE/SkfB family radical SAM enzyme
MAGMLSYFRCYRGRLRGLHMGRKLRYILKTTVGEITRARTLGAASLRMVEISVTERCQCNCPHCYARSLSDNGAETLSTEGIESVISQAAELGALEVCLTGGEPLLRADLTDLVDYGSSLGLLVKINTNGLLLWPEQVAGLKRAGLSWAMVSLDGAEPLEHDTFRGLPGCFIAAVAGLRELVRQRIPCGIVTVARRSLLQSGGLQDIVKLAHEIGVQVVRVLMPVPVGRWSGMQEIVLSQEERRQVREYTADRLVVMEHPKEDTSCNAAVTKFYIRSTGEVSPCVFLPYGFGNVHQESLRGIWRRMRSFPGSIGIKGRCPMTDPDFVRRNLSGMIQDAPRNPLAAPRPGVR